MIRKIFLTVAATLVAVTGLFAQELPDDPEVRKGVLDNGMTYYIRHNDKPANQAEFWIFDNVGALQEEDSQQGLAHFLEHMAFNGTENFPGKNMINYLESIGVKFGANLNAFTAQEMTCYNMSNVPVTREGVIDSALLILHDADAAQDADLRGGEADATGLLQRVRHVVEQLMQPVVEFRHRAADLCKAGVAHFVDLANSHNFILFSLL